MLPAFMTQKFLTRTVREFPVEAFVGQDILPIVGVPGLNTMWDIINKDAKLAGFVAINAESPLADKAGMERGFSELADIRIKERFDEDELMALREPGQADVVLEGLAETRRAVAERSLATALQRMTARVNGRVEWMRWQALSTGSISYDDGKVIFSVDFGIPGTHVITLTGTDRWDDLDDSDPLSDITDWVELIRADTGRAPDRMYVGSNIAKYLVNNEKIRALLAGTSGITSLLSLNTVLNLIGQLVGLRIERYDTTYQDGSGTDTRFLDADTVVLMPNPRQSDGEVLGDMASGPAKANNWETGLYAWVKEEEDPWATFIGAGIHAFPRLYHPGWIVAADTCGT